LRKRAIGLVSVLCAVFGVFVFLYLFGFPPFYRVVPLTISELKSSPDFWIGKRVLVQGVLTGPLIFIPEDVPPYNYVLQDPDTEETIGILWTGHDISLNKKNVTVIGVLRLGYTHPFSARTVYYIEAETIALSE